MKIEEAFRVKHEDTETQTKMVFIKEESEDMKKHSESNMKILRHKQRCVY